MTICVYKDNELAADGRVTINDGTYILSDCQNKTGIVYEGSDGVRSELPETLIEPKIFAWYAYAGSLILKQNFIQWFLSNDHPLIDAEVSETFSASTAVPLDTSDDGFTGIVIFKDYDIVRHYVHSYESHLFADFSRNQPLAVGSGSIAALSILTHDSKLSAYEVVSSVCKVVTSCGGSITKLNLGSPEPPQEDSTIENTINLSSSFSPRSWFGIKRKVNKNEH
jgi:hypothetical protein